MRTSMNVLQPFRSPEPPRFQQNTLTKPSLKMVPQWYTVPEQFMQNTTFQHAPSFTTLPFRSPPMTVELD